MIARMASMRREEALKLMVPRRMQHLSLKEIKALRKASLFSSNLLFGHIDDQLVCILGISTPTMITHGAHIWIHTTNVAREHAFVFVRQSQIILKHVLSMYPMVYGETHYSQTQSIRWLKWLGAKYGNLQPDGTIPFVIEARHGPS